MLLTSMLMYCMTSESPFVSSLGCSLVLINIDDGKVECDVGWYVVGVSVMESGLGSMRMGRKRIFELLL